MENYFGTVSLQLFYIYYSLSVCTAGAIRTRALAFRRNNFQFELPEVKRERNAGIHCRIIIVSTTTAVKYLSNTARRTIARCVGLSQRCRVDISLIQCEITSRDREQVALFFKARSFGRKQTYTFMRD